MVKYCCNSCGAELTKEAKCQVSISSTGAFPFTCRTIHMCAECLKNTLGYVETQQVEEEKIMREKRKAERETKNKIVKEENGL